MKTFIVFISFYFLFFLNKTIAQSPTIIGFAEYKIETAWSEILNADSITSSKIVAKPLFQFINGHWQSIEGSNIEPSQKFYYIVPSILGKGKVNASSYFTLPKVDTSTINPENFGYRIIPNKDYPKFYWEKHSDDYFQNSWSFCISNKVPKIFYLSNSIYQDRFTESFDLKNKNYTSFDNCKITELNPVLKQVFNFYKNQYAQKGYDTSFVANGINVFYKTIYSLTKIKPYQYLLVADIKGINIDALKRGIDLETYKTNALTLLEQFQSQNENKGIVLLVNTNSKTVKPLMFFQRLFGYGDFNYDGKIEYLFRNYIEGGESIMYNLWTNDNKVI